MKVTFLGVHYKRGFQALDSRTLSGRRIDSLAALINSENINKSNLFNSFFLPEGEFKDYLIKEFLERKEVSDEGIIVLLGKHVQKDFPSSHYEKAIIVEAYHPAYPKGHESTDQYIKELSTRINNLLN